MDELTFFLILASIVIVLLIAMFTYYKHHKKIRDEIDDFNHQANSIDDVLLNDRVDNRSENTSSPLPDSFSASKNEHLNLDDVNLMDERSFLKVPESAQESGIEEVDERGELVDGVYINSVRVIANPNPQRNPLKSYSKTTDTFNTHVKNTSTQSVKMVYDAPPEQVEEVIISLTILSKGEYFTGEKLYHAIQTAGLLFGDMNIFHYPGDNKAETFALFSLANLVEPGTFNPGDADSFSTPGVSLFMRLPARIDNNEAYDKLNKVAVIIATELDGELCDENRNRLTQQAVTHNKERIKKLNFELMKAEKVAQA